MPNPIFHNDGTFSLTKRSPFSGKEHTMRLKGTIENFQSWSYGGVLIQNAFPHLNSDEREFIMTGITTEEWNAEFGEMKEEYGDDNGEQL